MAACALFAFSAAPQPAAIFMYHHVSPGVLPGAYARALTVTPREFERDLIWLKRQGCALVTVERIVSQGAPASLAGCKVALTFDDGYDDAVRFALPLLQRYGAHATFYITSGLVGQAGHVSRADLHTLVLAGMEIGAHTVHHYDLTTLTTAQARDEIESSRRSLQAWTGARVMSFAYPAGRVNELVANEVRSAGFSNAVTTDPGFVGPDDNRFLLPRYRVLRDASALLLGDVLDRRHDLPAQTQAAYDRALHNIARRRIAGNEPQVAESVAVALLVRHFAEPIMKVYVLAIPQTAFGGIVLSGVKFHAPVNRRQFAADVREMAVTAFAAAPSLREVDIWSTVPIAVLAGEPVSGDLAVPTSKTVFSTAATRQRARLQTTLVWGTTYWDPHWLQHSKTLER